MPNLLPITPRRIQPSQRPSGNKRRHRWGLLILPLAALFLAGCKQSRYGLPDPATKQGDDVLKLWQVSFYGAVGLGALVVLVLFYSMIRHRRKTDELPKQTEGNVALEVTYTVIPFILVALLFAYGLKVQNVETKLVKNPDLIVDVTGYQWNWRFHYPVDDVTVEGGIQQDGDEGDTLALMVLPVNERVRFNLTAADVDHSFFVPGFLTKRDLIPGIRNEIEVTPKKLGFYMGHCAEYCGLNHSQMNFRVRIVSQADYATWIQSQKGASQKGQATAS